MLLVFGLLFDFFDGVFVVEEFLFGVKVDLEFLLLRVEFVGVFIFGDEVVVVFGDVVGGDVYEVRVVV